MKAFNALGFTSLLSFNFLQEGLQLERKLGVEFKRENKIKRDSFHFSELSRFQGMLKVR